MKKLVVLALVIFLLANVSLVQAKGTPSKAIISGGQLDQPVTITDPAVLDHLNPFPANFINQAKGLRSAPPDGSPTYRVEIYLPWGDIPAQLAYIFQYVPGQGGEPGWIYLPGRGEKDYSLNVGTIEQGQWDGSWAYASTAWEADAQQLLKVNVQPASGSIQQPQEQAQPQPAKQPSLPLMWVLIGVGVLAVAAAVVGYFRYARKSFAAVAKALFRLVD